MKKTLTFLFTLIITLCFAPHIRAQNTTFADATVYESIDDLPSTCNPQLRNKIKAFVKGGLEFTCVATPDYVSTNAVQVAAAKKIGTYQQTNKDTSFKVFTGLIVTVDAHDDQAATFAAAGNLPPGTSAATWNAGGTVEIYDMDYTTPLNIKSCSGYPAVAKVTNANPTLVKWTTTKNEDVAGADKDYRWCFQGEDARYRIVYNKPSVSQGDSNDRTNDLIWIADKQADKAGQVNIMDFGGAGLCLPDGVTSCYRAVKSANHWLAAHYGGELFFPAGDWLVDTPATKRPPTIGTNTSWRGIPGASDVTVGAGGTIAKSPTRIKITQANNRIVRIGELTEKVAFRDLEFYSTSAVNTVGVEGLGAFDSSQDMLFSNVTFTGFWRGLYTHKVDIAASDLDESWQFDYIKIENCRFSFNYDAALYADSQNSDWHIKGVQIIQPPQVPSSYTTTPTQAARGFVFNRSALVSMDQVFAGGTGNGAQTGGIFLTFGGSAGTVNIVSSQCENTWGSITLSGAGEYSYPIKLDQVIFGDKVRILAGRNIVSTGSLYGPDTWLIGGESRVWSFGDRWCYDASTRGCSSAGTAPPITRDFFNAATVMFMTGSPLENDANPAVPSANDYTLPSYPTQIGGALKIGSFATLGTTDFAGLTTILGVSGIGNGSIVYCSNCLKGSSPCAATADTALQGTLALREQISGDARWKCF